MVILACIAQCFITCIERIIEYFNRYECSMIPNETRRLNPDFRYAYIEIGLFPSHKYGFLDIADLYTLAL